MLLIRIHVTNQISISQYLECCFSTLFLSSSALFKSLPSLFLVRCCQATLSTELIKKLLVFAPPLQQAAMVVAELDCLMAFAECACNQHYCRPNLREDTALTIQGGRHPLAELVTNTYIPNDTKMGLEDERLHIITGPNASVSSNQI